MGIPAFFRLTDSVSHGHVKHNLSIDCGESVGKLLHGSGNTRYSAIAE